jgi:2-keto-4-pentenoate hydratase
MTITAEQRVEAAALLRRAEQDRQPIAPLTEQFPGLGIEDAYAIQLANISARLAGGATIRGHKVGLTAKVMQELLGVDEPDYGHLLDDMVFVDAAKIEANQFCAPRIEAEITFLLRRPLRGPGITIEDVLDATEAIAPSLEIVDSRIADWKITLADTIADNASSAAMVLAPWQALGDRSLPDVAVELVFNGEVVSVGTGRDVLGHPASAVAWLANALAAFDVTIEAGQFVMPGSCTSAVFVNSGDQVEARFAGLGSVSATFL